MSEGSGVIFCVLLKGFCFLTGTYFTMAAAANSLDNILEEPYFRELAIIREPALQVLLIFY
ncbi:hypothetical protein GCM10010211_64990 [Streptomyces albospinus]|uniref:Uncharacterized protein n=1 Tax=Streptomyces albospinus TaxID=285515 RepID=A0ABQ2VJ83_9ACTN|nr:hypothetical protein GCM10010211_64990 [Streptomyces albospinus]